MNIIVAWPPNIKEIKKVFDLTGMNPIFAFGDVIFNPGGREIDEPLAFHETTHSIQQENYGSVGSWWERYLVDKDFRLEQEIPAYRNQYARYCELVKDRNRRIKYLYSLAYNMASPMYGRMVDFNSALKIIRNGN